MSKVRCQNPDCRCYMDKSVAIPCGIGWACNVRCRDAARSHKRPKPRPKRLREDVRQEVLRRDGYRCRMCGSDKTHVHHVRYRSEGSLMGGSDLPTNLVTLCGPAGNNCHDRVHGGKRVWQPILLELLRLQYKEGLFMTVPEVARRMMAA